jgi:orotidine-5'-phosphate decarboxylase
MRLLHRLRVFGHHHWLWGECRGLRQFYKIGMEMLMTGQYFQLMDWLIAKDKKVFVDLKFFDVPETVGRTIKRLSQVKY